MLVAATAPPPPPPPSPSPSSVFAPNSGSNKWERFKACEFFFVCRKNIYITFRLYWKYGAMDRTSLEFRFQQRTPVNIHPTIIMGYRFQTIWAKNGSASNSRNAMLISDPLPRHKCWIIVNIRVLEIVE